MSDTRTPAEKAYDDTMSGALYFNPSTGMVSDALIAQRSPAHRDELTAIAAEADTLIGMLERVEARIEARREMEPCIQPDVRVSQGATDDGDSTWTDYQIGDVLISTTETGYQLIIRGCDIPGPITFALLGTLMIDLSRLLADDRVRLALGDRPLMDSVRALWED